MNRKMNNKDVHFPCTGCGECCRHINRVEQLAVYDRGDGVCKYLSGNLCSIYKDRPEICRVDHMYEKIFCNYMSREDYYEANLAVCRKLREDQNN